MSVDPDLLRRALAVAAPPQQEMTHAQVASSIRLPDGPRQGERYDWQDDPVHREVIRALDEPWDSVVGVGAVQTGKSLSLILVPTLRQVVYQRRAAVYSQPTAPKLFEAWTGKLQPSIVGAGCGPWLPQAGQGSKGGQMPRFVVFREPVSGSRAGMLYLIPGGGRNESAQAAVTAPTVLVDEVDSFQSAHRVTLVGKRADAFGAQARRVYTSTVKADGDPEADGDEGKSIILSMYRESTRSRLWHPCPHCGVFQPLEWEAVSYDAESEMTAAESVRIACPHCAACWTEDDRQVAIRGAVLVHHTQTVGSGGEIIGAPPPTRRWGLLWTSLDSTLRDLPTLAIEHWRATQALNRGEHGLMRSFVRDQLCRPYRYDVDESLKRLDLATLTARSAQGWSPATIRSDRTEDGDRESHSRHLAGEWPDGAGFACLGVDAQDDRLYWVLTAADIDGRTWDMGWGYEFGDRHQAPLSDAQFAEVARRIDGVARQACGPRFAGALMDVGDGGNLAPLLAAIEPLAGWLPCDGKGDAITSSTDPRDVPGYAYLRRPQGWRSSRPLVHVPSNSLRAQVQSAYLIPAGRPGAAHLPSGLDGRTGYIRHLIAEQAQESKAGNIIWRKRPGGGRHDWLDARIYSRAAIELLRPGRIRVRPNAAQEWLRRAAK
jgi:hypothetical protein